MPLQFRYIATLLIGLCQYSISAEVIRFAFEITQHGAISPSHSTSSPDYKDYFGEKWKGLNELTPVGQRQQYILGYHTRLRYIKDKPLLSKTYDPREIYVIATNANCTILSANAQLQGLYPPGTGETLNQRQLDNSNPPNDIAYYSKEREALGTNALPDKMTIIPVHNFYLKDHTFELNNPNNCPYMSLILKNKETDPKAKTLLDRFLNQFGDKIALMLGLKDKTAFNNYTLTKEVIETLIAEEYDGRILSKIKNAGMNTKELLEYCHEFVAYDLLYFDDNIKDSVFISMSPAFESITKWIKLKVSKDLNGEYDSTDYSPPKFVLYVSYAPSLVAFQYFVKYIWADVNVSYPRFASSGFIELIHNSAEAPKTEADYILRYRFNNKQYADVSYTYFIKRTSEMIKSKETIKLFCGWVDIKPDFNYYLIIVIALGILSITLTALIVFVIIKRKRDKDKELMSGSFK